MAEFQCLQCGKPFTAPPSRKAKYCSVPCMRIANPTKRHGYAGTREHANWVEMRNRCNTKNDPQKYAHYGAKGIKVCERWDSFENFLADMGHRPGPEYTIDRIDNDKGYEPGNCRWATRTEQSRNRTNTYTAEQDAKIREMIDAGCNFTTIAKALGKSHSAVSGRAYRIGLKSGQPPHPNQRFPSRAPSEGSR